MTFKALQGKLPEYISDMFKLNHYNISSLRSNDRKLYLKKTYIDFMKKSFSYRGLPPGTISQVTLSMITSNFP